MSVIHLSPGPRGLEEAGAALDRFCAAHDVPPEEGWRVKVSLDEALSNVMRHAGVGPDDTLSVTLRIQGGMVELVIADSGAPFDPLGVPPPDLAAPLEVRAPGGLGITLVRALMDDVRYERRGGENVLTLRKRLRPRSLP